MHELPASFLELDVCGVTERYCICMCVCTFLNTLVYLSYSFDLRQKRSHTKKGSFMRCIDDTPPSGRKMILCIVIQEFYKN